MKAIPAANPINVKSGPILPARKTAVGPSATPITEKDATSGFICAYEFTAMIQTPNMPLIIPTIFFNLYPSQSSISSNPNLI